MGVVTLRNGEEAMFAGKGPLGRILVGRYGEKPISWNLDGRWRWDDTDHPLDIIGVKSEIDKAYFVQGIGSCL